MRKTESASGIVTFKSGFKTYTAHNGIAFIQTYVIYPMSFIKIAVTLDSGREMMHPYI